MKSLLCVALAIAAAVAEPAAAADADAAVLTDTDTTLARGLLMPNPKLMLMPMLMPLSTMVDTTDTPVLTDMVCTTVDTMVDTTDTATVTLARGLLMPNPKLMPMLMPLSTMVDTT